MAAENLLMMVVTTASLLLSSKSTKRLPVVAFSTNIPHFLNVPVICLSKSVRSVTNIILGFRIAGSKAMA